MSQISRNLKQARKNAGLGQAEAAERLGIHTMTLSKYERGVVKKIPAEALRDAAILYRVSLDALTGGVIQKAERRLSQRAVQEPALRPPAPPDAPAAAESDYIVSEVAQTATRFNSRRIHGADGAELALLERKLKAAIRDAFEVAATRTAAMDSIVEGMFEFLTLSSAPHDVEEGAPRGVKESATGK